MSIVCFVSIFNEINPQFGLQKRCRIPTASGRAPLFQHLSFHEASVLFLPTLEHLTTGNHEYEEITDLANLILTFGICTEESSLL